MLQRVLPSFISTQNALKVVKEIFFLSNRPLHAIYSHKDQELLSTSFRIHLDYLGREVKLTALSQRYIQPSTRSLCLTPQISPGDKAYDQIQPCLLSLFSILEEKVYTTIYS